MTNQELTLRHCSSCGAAIVWVETEKGSRMPLDFKSEKRFVVQERHGKAIGIVTNTYASHFSTCPHADKHRGRREH